MRGGSVPERGNHKAGIKVEHWKVQEVNKQGCTVVLSLEEKRACTRQAVAHLLNASTVSPPCRTPCRTSPHRILLHCASPSYVFQFSHTHTKAVIPECLALSCKPISKYRNGRMCQITELFMIQVPNRSWRWHTEVPGHQNQGEENGPRSPENP